MLVIVDRHYFSLLWPAIWLVRDSASMQTSASGFLLALTAMDFCTQSSFCLQVDSVSLCRRILAFYVNNPEFSWPYLDADLLFYTGFVYQLYFLALFIHFSRSLLASSLPSADLSQPIRGTTSRIQPFLSTYSPSRPFRRWNALPPRSYSYLSLKLSTTSIVAPTTEQYFLWLRGTTNSSLLSLSCSSWYMYPLPAVSPAEVRNQAGASWLVPQVCQGQHLRPRAGAFLGVRSSLRIWGGGRLEVCGIWAINLLFGAINIMSWGDHGRVSSGGWASGSWRSYLVTISFRVTG